MIGDIIVAIEFQLVERSGNAKPAGHGGGFNAGDASFADDDDVAASHGAADQDDFELNFGVESEFARAQEKNAAGTDVPGDQSDGEIFGAAGDSTEAQR